MRLAALALTLLTAPVLAQPASPKFVGSWSGTMKQGDQDIEIVLNVAPADTGGFRAFIDLPSQNVRSMGVTQATFRGTDVTLPFGPARFEGRVDAAGNTIAGKMIGPGGEAPFSFTRTSATPTLPSTEAAVEDPDGRAGDYDGAIQAGGGLATTLHLRRTQDGYAATLDVPAQGAVGLSADAVTIEGDSISVVWGFGRYAGTFSADSAGIDGTWTQGGRDIELDYTRSAGDE